LQVAAFYAAALDEEAIEKDGTEPLKPLLALCDETVEVARKLADDKDKDTSDLATYIGRLEAEYGVSVFFAFGASPDNKNSGHSLCQIYQGGIGMPDRDYYFDEDKEEKRVEYKKHIATMFTLLDDVTATEPTEEAMSAANDVYNLELSLAEAHMTKTENRDPEATYNKMSIAEFAERCGGGSFDFSSFLKGATGKSADELGDINVRNIASLAKVAEVASSVDPAALSHYLKWHALHSCGKYLSKVFVMEDFRFYEKVLAGTDEIKPRWKRAMAFTESALGEALGQIYCAKYFDESSKAKALAIVESVRQALEERLGEVDWIKSESTREAALDKMSRFGVKIGYPDKWIDYTSLKVENGDHFLAMIFKSRAFDLARTVKEMNAPTDKDKWFMTPQTVNAYYHPSLNEIVFPAAFLQPPFFSVDVDDAINYGAMGAVIGHEMTHGFDDKGRKFNADGNMVDWWTKADSDEYEGRVKVMVEQANAYEVHGQSVQGKLTCGENIADLGGLRLAYRALKARPGFENSPIIDGFTQTQRFFLSWAQCWRQNITKERSLQLLTLDPHGPNEMRCNGPLSNIPEFLVAFDIPDDSPMFKPVEARADIW